MLAVFHQDDISIRPENFNGKTQMCSFFTVVFAENKKRVCNDTYIFLSVSYIFLKINKFLFLLHISITNTSRVI